MPDVPLVLDAVSLTLGGRLILDELSFSVAPGTITALLGPNGAGKSTTVRCCTGLLTPDDGRIAVFGHAPGDPGILARVGLMPQTTGAWSGVRPRELLRYLARLYTHPHDPDELLARIGVSDAARTPYRRLSGGQQQLVNLAGALVGRPDLVLLDEPTAGLDPHMRRHTWALLTELRAAGVSVLLTTHAMDEAERLADQVFIIDGGRVVVSGTVPELTEGRTLEEAFLAHTRPGAA